MRRMLPAIGADQFHALEAMGGSAGELSADGAGRRASELLRAMVEALPLPRRLREIGMAEADIPGIARATMGDYMMANVPREMHAAEIEDLLREAF
jgi:alcohol dehydrogenase class IV